MKRRFTIAFFVAVLLSGTAWWLRELPPRERQSLTQTPSATSAPSSVASGRPTGSGRIAHGDKPPPLEPVSSSLLTTGTVVHEASTDSPEGTVTVYRTSFKYPFIRVETRPSPGAGSPTRVRRMVADHLMVKIRPGADRAALAAHVAPHGASIRRQVGKRPIFLVALKDASPSTFDAALALWGKGDAVIEYAEPDHIASIGSAPVIPNDPAFTQQWNMHNLGGGGKLADADIDAPEAWAVTTGDSAITLAVIDSGIDLTHPDLQGNLWTNVGESGGGKESDGIDNDGNGYVDDVHGWNFSAGNHNPDDDHGHGSHVAGTIGAVGGNGIGIAGVCHSVRLMALKFLDVTGSGTDSDAIEAIAYATDNGAFATNNSWGGSDFTLSMQTVIEEADAAGVGFIAAAGNDGTNNDIIPNYPCNFPVPNVISVAATDYTDTLTWFSCYGSQTVHLGAPGFQTWSASKDGGYQFMSGTSMAAPHVTGAVALLKAANPNLSFSDIKTMLIHQVDSLPSMNGKSISGGRLNLAKALIPATAPLLRTEQMIVDDSDGIPSPGETVSLIIPVKNLGAEEAVSVSGVLSLQSADPLVNIIQDSAFYGDLPFQASAENAPPYLVQIAAGKNPGDVPMVITLSSGTQTWSQPLTLRIRNVASLSGTVTLVSGGSPVEDAVIEISGPETHSLLTDAAGQYSVSLTNGTYQVRATKAGFVPSQTTSVTISTTPQTANFVLGASDAQVSPGSLSMTLQEGQNGSQVLTISNLGDVPLPYEIKQVPPSSLHGAGGLHLAAAAPASVSPALTHPPEGLLLPEFRASRFLDASRDAVATIPWSDGFEDGLWGRWWPANSEAVREVVSDTAGEGMRSFHLRPTTPDHGHLTGLEQWFSYHPKPGYISFWVRPGPRDSATSYMVLGDVYWMFTGSGFSLALADFIWFFANANGRFYLNDDVGGNQLVAYAEGAWYQIEFRELNWTTRTFDYWVNGSLVQSAVPFRNPTLASGMAVAFAYNYMTQTDAWWDEVKFYDDALPWITLSSTSGSLPPGGSASVTATFNAQGMKPGTHNGSLLVRTNDPDTPEHQVALTLTVTDGPNQTPVALPQTITMEMNHSQTITLGGSDPENDALSCYIVSLPHKGTLYQTSDGTTPGAPITTTPKRVSSPLRQVIYVPNNDETGAPYASFEFVVRDAEDESARAAVSLHVLSGPLLYVTPSATTSGTPVTVHLSSSDPTARIAFTTDGSTPTPTSLGYFGSGILHVDRSVTLKIIAFGPSSNSDMQTVVIQITDSDSDGLPDWWETSGGASLNHAAASDDPDGNGLTAMQEFIAGIPPGSGAGFHSRLAVDASHTVTWQSTLGRVYYIESCDDAESWTAASSAYFGTGAEMHFSTPATSGKQFYRVRAELP